MKFINSETNSVTRDIVSVYCVNINVIAKQTEKKALHQILFEIYSGQWQSQQKFHSLINIFGRKCECFSHSLEPCVM